MRLSVWLVWLGDIQVTFYAKKKEDTRVLLIFSAVQERRWRRANTIRLLFMAWRGAAGAATAARAGRSVQLHSLTL